MPTFQQSFCADYQCGDTDFSRLVFWRTLPPHAVLVAALLGGYRARHFAPDREFIRSVADAVSIDQIRESARDYILDSKNRGWLRHRLRIRVSVKRMKALARGYLPDRGVRPSLRVVELDSPVRPAPHGLEAND